MANRNGGQASLWKAVGLILALVVPLLYSLLIGPSLVQPATTSVVYALVGFGVYWALAFCLIAITRFGEGEQFASLGVKRVSRRMVAVAVVLGVLLSVAVPLLTLVTSQIVPVSEARGVTDTANRYPAWVILLSILTAGITEEVLFRGYGIERLLQLTGNKWASGLISLAAFILAHLSGWNLAHIVGVVLPLGGVLTGLYLWRRNLVFVIIVHILVDLPLFFIALGS